MFFFVDLHFLFICFISFDETTVPGSAALNIHSLSVPLQLHTEWLRERRLKISKMFHTFLINFSSADYLSTFVHMCFFHNFNGYGSVHRLLQSAREKNRTLPYITIHYHTLPYVTIHYHTYHTLRYITIHFDTLRYITIHSNTWHQACESIDRTVAHPGHWWREWETIEETETKARIRSKSN